LTAIVLDASAGVELALQTPIGRQIRTKLPAGAITWVPEHYYPEAVAVLRRLELNRRYDPSRIQLALDRLLAAPITRVSVKPLIPKAWRLRHNLTLGDALYVVVAQQLDAPLVTSDLKLASAPDLGVETITPGP
jgi:predicted nucleic acid-binding protein